MFPLRLKGIRAGPVAATAPAPGEAGPPRAGPRHLCTQRLRLPHKYSKFLIKTYDCVNSAAWAPNLEKPFHRPPSLSHAGQARAGNSSPASRAPGHRLRRGSRAPEASNPVTQARCGSQALGADRWRLLGPEKELGGEASESLTNPAPSCTLQTRPQRFTWLLWEGLAPTWGGALPGRCGRT